MRLKYFASVLSAVSALSFAAAACSERPGSDPSAEADAQVTNEPAPPVESSALPADAVATATPADEATPSY